MSGPDAGQYLDFDDVNRLAKSRGLLAVAVLLIVAGLAWAAPRLVRHYYHHGLRLVEVATGLPTLLLKTSRVIFRW